MKRIFLLLFATSLLISCKKDTIEEEEQQGATKQIDIAVVDNAVTGFMNKWAIPGGSIAIVKNGKLVYAKAYGQVGKNDNTPVTNNSLFRIASVSKPVTSVGILKLLEAGKLTLNSKVFGPNSILGADYTAAPQATHDITINQLLQHTVGSWGNTNNDPMFSRPELGHNEHIKWTLANYPAPVNKRGQHAYSNFGYSLLGRVIEKLSGKSYEQFIKDEVLKPSGISTMVVGGNKLADRKSGEVIYSGQGGWDPYNYNISRMDAHGGWIASATDLAKFMVRVDGFTNKPDILKPETIRIMTTRDVPSSYYAAGWGVNDANNWWHTGSLPGTAAEIIRSSSGYSWVLLFNSRSYAAGFDAALDNLFWPIVNSPSTPWQDIDQF